MIYDVIADHYKNLGLQFKVSGEDTTLDYQDIEKILDDAAKHLYKEPVGTQYERAGMIVRKTETGFVVFAYVGTLQ